MAFGVASLIFWHMLSLREQQKLTSTAESGGMLTLLLAIASFVITTDGALLLIGPMAVALILLLIALLKDDALAQRWGLISLILYGASILLRQFIPALRLHYPSDLLIPLYLFPPVIFMSSVWLGRLLARHWDEIWAKSVCLQQDLHEQTLQYQRLLETMNEGFVIVDEREVFTFVNNKFCELFGYSREELIDRRNDEVIVYDETSLTILQQQIILRTQNQCSTYELNTYRKDGRPLTILVSAMPNFDANGHFRGAISVVMDVTERKQMEATLEAERTLLSQRVEERTATLQALTETLQQELTERKAAESALRVAEAEYRALFDHIPIGIYRSSLDGQQLRANPTLVAMKGYASEAEMLREIKASGRDWYVDQERRAEFQRTLAEQGSVTNFESEVYCYKTRKRVWISESALLILGPDGQPLYYQGVVQDITKRKQIEQEQERLIFQLAKVAKLKDEFLASMSHELRTPLNSILGMTEALQDEIYGQVTAKQMKALGTIDASGRHLLSLINDILDLAKIESGQVELVRGTVEVDATCQAAIRLMQGAAHKKRIQLTLTLDPQVRTLVADGRRLKQILLNLLSNAVKFTPEEGSVGLDVMGQRGAEPSIQFIVWDTGVGIPQKDRENLFKPFVQLDSSLTRHYEGTGLGLALVHRMVELHGGHISVESVAGQGSRFCVTLPWQQPKHGMTISQDAVSCTAAPVSCMPTSGVVDSESTLSVPALEGPTAGDGAETATLSSATPVSPLILVVDDNAIAAQGLVDYLSFKGYRVETAADGIQAIMKADTLQPALILMDLQMPGMNGIEAIRHMRTTPKLAATPIVVLSALAVNRSSHKAEIGADVYLSKPITLTRLQDTIQQLLHADAKKVHTTNGVKQW
ncbi:MAG: PAS domain S-box protein [Caldilineaceae bacterium]